MFCFSSSICVFLLHLPVVAFGEKSNKSIYTTEYYYKCKYFLTPVRIFQYKVTSNRCIYPEISVSCLQNYSKT
jgi:hypothetical protein